MRNLKNNEEKLGKTQEKSKETRRNQEKPGESVGNNEKL